MFQMSGQGQPELSVDLNGALIDPGVKKSSRKNVFILNTFLGLQVLIQSDCVATTDQWVHAIQTAINNLVTIDFLPLIWIFIFYDSYIDSLECTLFGLNASLKK